MDSNLQWLRCKFWPSVSHTSLWHADERDRKITTSRIPRPTGTFYTFIVVADVA